MGNVTCFWLEPTDRERRWLRRYVSQSVCAVAPHGYHQALVRVEDAPAVLSEEGYHKSIKWPRDDPRWPNTCACGHVFTEEDVWQLFSHVIYRRADTGEETTLREAPPGAMWDAWWFGRKGPDGKCLCVKLPGGFDWCPDCLSSDGQPWTRTGEIPRVTARPSIGVPDGHGGWKYHGFLTDGVLSEV